MEFIHGKGGEMYWLLRIVYGERLVSDIGRACLMEVGYESRW